MKSVMKGSELKRMRLSAGLSQLALANMLDSEQRQISLWERDLVKINKIKALAIRATIGKYILIDKKKVRADLNEAEKESIINGFLNAKRGRKRAMFI